MRNIFSKSNVTPIVETKSDRKPDMLDVLLRLTDTERKAVLKAMKEGDKLIDEVQVTYGVKDRPKTSGLVWVC